MKKKNSTYINYQKIGAENLNSNNKKKFSTYENQNEKKKIIFKL